MKDALGHGSDAHGTGIAAAVPSPAYAIHKAHNGQLDAINKQHAATLDTFPKGPMNLTPDSVKATPEYQTARANFNRSFSALRDHNAFMSKNFGRQMKADRDAKRQARIAK